MAARLGLGKEMLRGGYVCSEEGVMDGKVIRCVHGFVCWQCVDEVLMVC